MPEGHDGHDPAPSRDRLIEITLDTRSIRRADPNIDHEREVAIYDILDSNSFRLVDQDAGPYRLNLGLSEDRIVLKIADADAVEQATHAFSISPFRRVIKDYFLVCGTYYEAIRTAPPSRIQAIDTERRNLHDEGSRLLTERLDGKIAVDHDTARRLFTLICALHVK